MVRDAEISAQSLVNSAIDALVAGRLDNWIDGVEKIYLSVDTSISNALVAIMYIENGDFHVRTAGFLIFPVVG